MKDTRKRPFEVYLPGSKSTPPKLVATIEVDVYDNFGEEFITQESRQNIERTKARYLGLMIGEDIVAMRKRLDLSQSKLTALLQCGDKSLSRWENGHGYPTGIVNTMLRLLDEGFLAPASLEAVAGPRSELSTERFFRNRKPTVVHFDFKRAQPHRFEAPQPDEDYLLTAANS